MSDLKEPHLDKLEFAMPATPPNSPCVSPCRKRSLSLDQPRLLLYPCEVSALWESIRVQPDVARRAKTLFVSALTPHWAEACYRVHANLRVGTRTSRSNIRPLGPGLHVRVCSHRFALTTPRSDFVDRPTDPKPIQFSCGASMLQPHAYMTKPQTMSSPARQPGEIGERWLALARPDLYFSPSTGLAQTGQAGHKRPAASGRCFVLSGLATY